MSAASHVWPGVTFWHGNGLSWWKCACTVNNPSPCKCGNHVIKHKIQLEELFIEAIAIR